MKDTRLKYWYVVHAEKEILLKGKVTHEESWVTLTENAHMYPKVIARQFDEKEDYEAFLLKSLS